MTFQNKINLDPAKGWHGDFASTNSRVSLLGSGAFQVAKSNDKDHPQIGIQAGSFVWVDDATQTVVNTTTGTAAPDGFVGRELTGVTSQYLEENSLNIPPGFMVTVYEKGEFLVLLPADVVVTRGEIVNVDGKTGAISKKGIATTYKYVTSAKSGDLVAISAWI